MSKAADFTAIAVRLDNLEQKATEGDGGLAALVERIYKNAFLGSESADGVGYDPKWSNNPSIFDDGLSLSWSVWGGWRPGGGAPTALVNAIGDAPESTPFYSQVFEQEDTRWLQHGSYDGKPLATVIFGKASNTGYLDVLASHGIGANWKSLSDAIFGSSDGLDDLLSEGASASIKAKIDDLESRVSDLESRVSDLESWASDVNGILSGHASTLATHTSQIAYLLDKVS